METQAVLCNVLLCVVTGFLVATEGIPDKPAYAVFTLLMLLVPVLTALTIMRRPSSAGRPGPAEKGHAPAGSSAGGGWRGTGGVMRCVAASCNLVLLGFVCWALVGQYPYPEGAGVIPYAAVALVTPVVSLAVLVRSARASPRGRQP